MSVIIRPGRVEDADGIAAVHVASWRTTYAGIVPDDYLAALDAAVMAGRWRERLKEGTQLILVAQDEDASRVVGFASGGALREAIDGYHADGELYAIYLLQEKQTQGTGRLLVQRFAAQLRADGFSGLVVWVLEKNPAVGFYSRLGGTRISQKTIEIGGAQLQEIALGWPDLQSLL
jgi:ribosomal protein S18 acetylase RimI-like enzyme